MWFSVYIYKAILMCSNYDKNEMNCINNLIYVITRGQIDIIGEQKMEKDTNIDTNINTNILESDFIRRDLCHNFKYSVKYDDGIIYIYKCNRNNIYRKK